MPIPTEISAELTRRSFLKLAAGTAAVMAIGSLPSMPSVSAASATELEIKSSNLENIFQTTPLQMAQSSKLVNHANAYILQRVQEIRDGNLRNRVLSIINNPAPTIMERYNDSTSVDNVWQQLHDNKLIGNTLLASELFPPFKNTQSTLQPFLSAPGSGYNSHHSYPGGLSTHTAANLHITLAIYQTYQDVFGYSVDKDIIIAAQALHDLHKPWVFQWKEDGSLLQEQTIAGTGAHHILSMAEAIYRDFPAEEIVAQACAHNHPGTVPDEIIVVNWIKAASIIAGVDPIQKGLLDTTGKTLPSPHKQEGYIVHLGDHDFVLSVPAAQKSAILLQEIAREQYQFTEEDLHSAKFNTFRNYICSQVSMMNINHLVATDGKTAVSELIKKIIL